MTTSGASRTACSTPPWRCITPSKRNAVREKAEGRRWFFFLLTSPFFHPVKPKPNRPEDMTIIKMTDLDLKGKRVLIREDLNVPVADGAVTSDARIRAALPTIHLALEQGAKVMLMSHLGRPEEGVYAEEFSLAPVAERLTELLGVKVR